MTDKKIEIKTLLENFPRTVTFKDLYDTASKLKREGNDTPGAVETWNFLYNNRDKIPPHYTAAVCFKLGELALETNENERARDFLEQCIAINPNHIKALHYLNRSRLYRDQWSKLKESINPIIHSTDETTGFPFKKEEPGSTKPAIRISPTEDRREYPFLVTAVISAYKSEAHIRGCLLDLVNQTIGDRLEIIVVDSGSPQNEGAIVKEFQQTYNNIVYIRTEERETIYKAWNRGVKIARGKYITNANTDDRHRKDAFEILAGYLDRHPDIDVVYPRQIITDKPGSTFETVEITGHFDWPEFDPGTLLEYCFIGPQPMWRSSLHHLYHFYFDENLEVSGDYDFWLRLSPFFQFKLIPIYLGIYYKSPDFTNKEWSDRYRTLFEQHLVLRRFYRHMLQNMDIDRFRDKMRSTIEQVDALLPLLQENEGEVKRKLESLLWALALQLEFIDQTGPSLAVSRWALSFIGESNRLARHIVQLKPAALSTVKNPKALVSIIIPYFNNEATVTETLGSVEAQTYTRLEVIIVDNHSEKTSRLRLNENLRGFPGLNAKVLESETHDPGPHRNIAVWECRGDYILPLDADDLISPFYVEKTLREFEKDSLLDVVFTETIAFGYRNELWVRDELSVPRIYMQNQVNVTALIKKESFTAIGGYDEKLPGYEDWELWIRMAKRGMRFKHIPEPLFFYRHSMSSRGYLSSPKDFVKRKAIMTLHPDIYRPVPGTEEEKSLLQQNFKYIPPHYVGDLL